MITNAPCAGMWVLFDSTEPQDHLRAKAICNACPALEECRRYRRETTYGKGLVPEGTWAGIPSGVHHSWKCGTAAGYDAHRHVKEPACEPCKQARRDHERERRFNLRRNGKKNVDIKDVNYADRKIGESPAA